VGYKISERRGLNETIKVNISKIVVFMYKKGSFIKSHLALIIKNDTFTDFKIESIKRKVYNGTI